MSGKIARRTWTELLEDHDWCALVTAYRVAPNASTSSALLATLAPAAREICLTLRPVPGVADQEDVWQQYQMAVLVTASRMGRLRTGDWIPVCLLQGARRRVARWLRIQARQQSERLREDVALVPSAEDQALDGIDIQASHPLYRRVVLGESYERQAERLGISPAALRKRVSRDIEQLRALQSEGRVESVVEELQQLVVRHNDWYR